MASDSEPVPESKPGPDTGNETDVQRNDRSVDIPRAVGRSSTPPANTHCEITHRTEKDWWTSLSRLSKSLA